MGSMSSVPSSSRSPRVKICGLTDVADAQLAVELGAWALGVVLFPDSVRHCSPQRAAEIATALRRRAEICGVFVNAPLDEVAEAAGAIGLSMIQLHGQEGPAYCAEIARRTGCRVIKAVRVRSGADIRALRAFHTDFHLVDTYVSGTPGGTGVSFDWSLLRGQRRTAPLILSGGLDADNVAGAIAGIHPFAVDVASGTEATPGRKDPDRLAAFFAAVAASTNVSEDAARPGGREEPARHAVQ